MNTSVKTSGTAADTDKNDKNSALDVAKAACLDLDASKVNAKRIGKKNTQLQRMQLVF